MDLGNRIGFALAGLALLVAAPLSAEDAAYDLDIESQPLAAALKEFAEQSGLQVVYYSKLADGEESSEVSGAMTADQAMMQLLASTDLTFDTMGDDTVVIEEAPAKAESKVASESGNSRQTPGVMMIQASTSASGYRNRVSRQRQDEESSSTDEPIERLEEIIVTGTNIRGVENPTVPVLTFDKDDIDLSGAVTVDEFLRAVPQNFSSTTQLTAESGNPNAGSNLTQGAAVDLRGLGAGSTLTLLNGRRMSPAGISNYVDVSILPLGAIERIDILTDSATATYGSDAVGGVVNFVTRKDFQGFDINTRYSSVSDGSKEDWGVGAAGGFSWSTGGVFVGGDYQEQKPLFVAERTFVDLLIPQEGSAFGTDSERLSLLGGLNQSFSDRLRLAADVLLADSTSVSNSVGTSDPRVNTADQNATFINARLDYDFSDALLASLFFDYGENEVQTSQLTPDSGFEAGSDIQNSLSLVEGRLAGELFRTSAGAASFAVGGLYREEEYSSISGGQFDVPDASREVSAAYAELLVPLISPDQNSPLVQRLDVSLAARYEEYSDVGNSFDPKIGAYLEFGNTLSLRASFSSSFRAPDLQSLKGTPQLFISPFPTSTITAFEPPPPSDFLLPFPFPDFNVVGFSTAFNPNLGPESAESFTVGARYEPRFIDRLSLTINYFDIAYEDRIENISPNFILQDPALLELAVVNPSPETAQALFDRAANGEIELFSFFGEGPDDIQIILESGPQNVAQRDVKGFDFGIQYDIDTKVGSLSSGVNAAYLTEYSSKISETSTSADQLSILYRPVDLRIRANVSWERNGFTTFAAVNYVGEYQDSIDNSIANDISSWVTVDMALSYQTGERFDNRMLNGLRLGLNVINLLDEEPPFVATPFGLNYDSANADPFMRQFRVSVSKAF